MPILRLIAKIRNVLHFRTAKATNQRKFTSVELQEMAERDNFGEILTAVGISDNHIPEAISKKWASI
jgi:hypothetical protein